MKKFILILILSGSLLANAQQLSNSNICVNKSVFNVQNFVDSVLTELSIDSTLVMIVPTLQISGRYEGLCIRNNQKTFTILINEQSTFDTFRFILAHELIHVWQYQNNLNVIGKEIIFNGLTYEADSKRHDERPHEIQAKNEGEKLFRLFKNIR